MRLVVAGQPLEEKSIEIPTPGPGSALVKVEAAGVCHTDIHLISGGYDLGEGKKLSAIGGNLLPLTPGHEIAGRVEALGGGTESSGFKTGDEVVVYPWIGCGVCRKCRSGKENLCEGGPQVPGLPEGWRIRRVRPCAARPLSCARQRNGLPAGRNLGLFRPNRIQRNQEVRRWLG